MCKHRGDLGEKQTSQDASPPRRAAADHPQRRHKRGARDLFQSFFLEQIDDSVSDGADERSADALVVFIIFTVVGRAVAAVGNAAA